MKNVDILSDIKGKSINIRTDNTRPLDDVRKEAMRKYISLNNDFKVLSEKSILTHIEILKVQLENDPDNKKTKKEIEYIQFVILPFSIYEWATGKDRCLDNYPTEIIEYINKRIEIKVDTYKYFID